MIDNQYCLNFCKIALSAQHFKELCGMFRFYSNLSMSSVMIYRNMLLI